MDTGYLKGGTMCSNLWSAWQALLQVCFIVPRGSGTHFDAYTPLGAHTGLIQYTV